MILDYITCEFSLIEYTLNKHLMNKKLHCIHRVGINIQTHLLRNYLKAKWKGSVELFKPCIEFNQ